MAQDKVSRVELRQMKIGQTRIFQLTDRKKITSARVQATQLGHEEDMNFLVKTDYQSSSVSITRLK